MGILLSNTGGYIAGVRRVGAEGRISIDDAGSVAVFGVKFQVLCYVCVWASKLILLWNGDKFGMQIDS